MLSVPASSGASRAHDMQSATEQVRAMERRLDTKERLLAEAHRELDEAREEARRR